jgi:hypothetical protein
MNILTAVKNTFKNVDKMSIAFIYIGLEFTLGLIAVSIVITSLEGHYGDCATMICYAIGAREAAFTCGALSLVAAFICDAAAKDRANKG